MLERILRGAALLIAIVAFLDPALTRASGNRATVVVFQAAPSDRDLTREVIAALEPTFDVARTDVPGAAAYVIAGNDLPEGWRPALSARVFSITPATTSPALKIVRFSAPIDVSLESIALVDVEVQVDGSGDREVAVSLLADGVRLSQTSQRLTGVETRLRAPLKFVPSHTGLVRLRVEATLPNRPAAVADKVIDVHARSWQVLAFDGRPSYASTFARRALESDPRFKVSTRVVTSKASAVQTNVAPAALTDFSPLSVFDLIVVGGIEVLGDTEARTLQRYLRERRGSVILLPETSQGVVLQQLTGQTNWQDDRRIEPVAISPVASTASAEGVRDAWSAAEFLWPARWPPLAEALATVTQPGKDAPPLSAVWQMPVGGGRLAVSSAVDAWRSRAGAASGFSGFWRTTAARLAQATPPAIDVRMTERLLTPGQWASVSVGMFAGGDPTAQVSSGSAGHPVRLWPFEPAAASTGREWSGAFRTPDSPGKYRLRVTGPAGAEGTLEFLVVAADGEEAPVSPAQEREGLSALAATAHGGRVVPAEQLSQLPAQILEGLAQNPAREPWHPMRSIWWLVPFTLCAAGEWWLRRHRGER